jgi:hypothetical protein
MVKNYSHSALTKNNRLNVGDEFTESTKEIQQRVIYYV